MLYKKLYSEIGKLLYAVADMDMRISPVEKAKLQEIVNKELMAVEARTDEFGTPLAYYTEIEFDYLEDEIMDAETAFDSFINFVDEHQKALDIKMIELSIHVARELARAYYGTNLREELLLERLIDKLQRIKEHKRGY